MSAVINNKDVCKQGQSPKGTPHKERLFSAMIGRSVRLYAAKGWPFVICDGFCGSGYNEQAQCQGSPLTINEILLYWKVDPKKVRVIFVDVNEQALVKLEPLLVESPYYSSFTFINGRFEDTYSLWIPGKNSHGLVLIDPNNPKQFPFDALLEISRFAPKIDFILNYPSQTLKRVVSAANGFDTPAWHFWKGKKLDDLIYPLKTHWQLSRIIPSNHGFICFFGSNMKWNSAMERDGIFSLDSAVGQSIMEAASNSQKDLNQLGGKTQFDLFGRG